MSTEKRTTLNDQQDAFNYLQSLPSNEEKVKSSAIICENIAKSFTDTFRSTNNTFTIPVSWSMTKAALLNLLGIPDSQNYPAISGIRLYAGLNTNLELTLIAVSTQPDSLDSSKNNDLTINDDYPYYDYADPCPTHCSGVGNLKLIDPVNMNFARVVNQ